MVLGTRDINNYDNQILNKVKSWYNNTIFADTAIVYNTIYNLMDNTKDKFKVPMMSIYRPRGFDLVPMQSFAATKQGLLYGSEELGARYIVVNLMYQIDIYAKTPEELNSMAVAVIKGFEYSPTLEVVHKDPKTEKEFKESYEINYLSGPVQQSEFSNDNRVYRYYIQYEIKNAKLYDFSDLSKIIEVETELDIES